MQYLTAWDIIWL